MFEGFIDAIRGVLAQSGFANINILSLIMLTISCILLYLAIVKGFEPLLLLPIAFGMFLANIPLSGLGVLPKDIKYFLDSIPNLPEILKMENKDLILSSLQINAALPEQLSHFVNLPAADIIKQLSALYSDYTGIIS